MLCPPECRADLYTTRRDGRPCRRSSQRAPVTACRVPATRYDLTRSCGRPQRLRCSISGFGCPDAQRRKHTSAGARPLRRTSGPHHVCHAFLRRSDASRTCVPTQISDNAQIPMLAAHSRARSRPPTPKAGISQYVANIHACGTRGVLRRLFQCRVDSLHRGCAEDKRNASQGVPRLPRQSLRLMSSGKFFRKL
jgi:hypothetical protein